MAELVDEIPLFLRRPVRIMLAVKYAFISVAALIMAFTFFFVVIFRYVFETDLFAYEEWLMLIVFWLYFLGGAVGSYQNAHINADVLNFIITNTRRKWMKNVAVNTIEFSISLIFIYWAALMMIEELSSYPDWQTTIALRIPFAASRMAIFIGFVLVAFYNGLHLYVCLKSGPPAQNSGQGETIAAQSARNNSI